MGQVSQAFDHIKDNKEITELSVVLYPDSFFCGFWNAEDLLLKAEFLPQSKFRDCLLDWNHRFHDITIRLMNTNMPYLHLHEEDYESAHFDKYFNGIYDLRKRKNHVPQCDNFLEYDIHTLHLLGQSVSASLKENKLNVIKSHISTAMSNYTYLVDGDILIFMQGNKLHILCHKDGEFRFYNQFFCVDISDYLYFILLVLQSFEIDSLNSNIYMGGDIDRTSKLYARLRSYIPGLSVIDDHIVTRENVESPYQAYFELFLCKSCVS